MANRIIPWIEMHDLYLFYGATFFGAGVLLAFQARLPPTILPRFALLCLAGFGVVHGLSEWAQMEVVVPGAAGHDRSALRLAGLILGVLSFALLAQFAVMVLARYRSWPRWLIGMPILLAIAWLAITATMTEHGADDTLLRYLEAASRYAFGLPASLLAARALWVLRRGERDRIARFLAGASWTFVAYALFGGVLVGPAPFFPASHLNAEAFRALTHVPVEIFRIGTAVALAFCVSEAFVIQAARERAELEHRREEFISIVAHDLRSPIGVINLSAELLEAHLKGIERGDQQILKKLIRNIRTGAHGLERMVGDLLDATRIDTNMLALEKRAVELRSLVSGIVERAAEATRDHAVRAALPENLPTVQADPVRVEQIVVNLLSNAAKYSTPNTEITIEASARPAEVEIAVTNQGTGLSPEEIGRVFSRFYRSKEHARLVEGLGLGLYIVKGLVEAHGGRIWVDSEPGRFATFRFTLPRADAPSTRAAAPAGVLQPRDATA